MTHLARSIAVVSLATCIYIFTVKDICFFIAELATVKYADLDYGYLLLYWNQKSPPPKRRANEWVAVRMVTGCWRHPPKNVSKSVQLYGTTTRYPFPPCLKMQFETSRDLLMSQPNALTYIGRPPFLSLLVAELWISNNRVGSGIEFAIGQNSI